MTVQEVCVPTLSVQQTTLLRGQLLKKGTTVDLAAGGTKHWMDMSTYKDLVPTL